MANPTTNFGWVMPTSTSLVTNLPADFNTFGQGVDTSLQYLLGGTTGQVLSKTSGTNMAFTWVTPTDQTPLTTKGDLFAFTTVDARLAVGADGTALVADSAQATGLAYKTPGVLNGLTTTGDTLYSSSGTTQARLPIGTTGQVLTVAAGVPSWASISAGGLTLIATATPSSASTVSFTSIPTTYKHLMIVTTNLQQSASQNYWGMRFNNDSAGNYNYKGIGWYNTTPTSVYSSGATMIGGTYYDAPILACRDISSPLLAQHGNGTVMIYNYASTTLIRGVEYTSFGYNAGGAQNVSAVIGASYASTGTAITQVDFIRGSTQTISGTIQLYGVS